MTAKKLAMSSTNLVAPAVSINALAATANFPVLNLQILYCTRI